MTTQAVVRIKNITPFDEIVLEIEDLFAEAENWADGTSIENQAQCDALDVLDKSLLDAGKRLDALRVEETSLFLITLSVIGVVLMAIGMGA